MKRNKWFRAGWTALCMACLMSACGGKEGTDDAVKYGVTVTETANGEITSSVSPAKKRLRWVR